ncbi:MAG: sulfurtransferase-like selenium metabolism protein YedF [Tissierellia bacterium]|nr:sulfurtransferase-like selenium metabolism protein YedF [Tissierellia bacterium]
MYKIDAVGIACPMPVIMTKKKLDEIESGKVEIIADNDICVQNLIKFAKSNGYEYDWEELEEDRFRIIILKDGNESKDRSDGEGDFTIAIGSNLYGSGDEKLGEILMRSFIYTVSETEPLPKKIVFYNSGVYLTTESSDVLDDLENMEKEGVEIISCGTCLDFYGLKDKLKVGSISNMYDIYEAIRNAGRNMVIG